MRACELLAVSIAKLREANVPDATKDARILLAYAWGIDRVALVSAMDKIPSNDITMTFHKLIEQRAKRQPVSQLVGSREFWGRRFRVSMDVLDPRPDTETLVTAALEGADPETILEIGVGSGALIISLLHHWPNARAIATDISQDALDVAQKNAQDHGVEDRLTLICGSWEAGEQGPFDLIVSNPPYISKSDILDLDPEVREWEPTLALDGGEDGFDAYRAIAVNCLKILKGDGRLLVEIGINQRIDVSNIFTQAGWKECEVNFDLSSIARILEFTKI